ncbi:unnamed protein product [Mytilus edulis]|uniref:Endonuclease/exonuclease/phosphatase domain-containing protein n=1 Tax=Mytilus edulis TaxID=6550 RepID=A0A8S3RSH1_MYTED|nr:unnamed protein product [Mytilus edulis]
MSLAGKKNNIATRSQKNSTSSMSNNENEVWKCNICKNSFTENTDKIVQCEYCSECFCSKCLSLSKNEYDTFKNPSLHWFCPNCEEKVMKNLKSDREIEVRCAEFMQKMECRLVNLETEMKSKVNTEQVNDIVKSLIGTCGTGNEAVSVDIEKSVEMKLSEIRDSSSRENIIIHGVKESTEKLPSDRKEADKHFFSELLEYLHADIIGDQHFNGQKHASVLSELKCVYTNADSFINKFDEFKTRFINEESDPDIIIITEVLPKNSRYRILKAELSIDGYDIFPENFPTNSVRGIIIYVKQELQAVEIDIKHEFKEYVCLKINLVNNDKLLVGCIYKSPSSSEEQHKALNDLLVKISKLEDSYSHVLLTGDFNFPDINWETWSAKDNISTNFLECIRDCYYQQMVDKPTRYRINQEPSLLDLILVNDKNFIQNIEYQDPIGHSDHNVLVLTLNVI